MAHRRKIVLSGISMTMAKPNKHSLRIGPLVMDKIEELLISSDFFKNAPFSWVGLALRFGLKFESKPHYFKIDKKDGELPLAIEIDTNELLEADEEKVERIFTKATLTALIHAGKKYSLPIDLLENKFEKMENLEKSV